MKGEGQDKVKDVADNENEEMKKKLTYDIDLDFLPTFEKTESKT